MFRGEGNAKGANEWHHGHPLGLKGCGEKIMLLELRRTELLCRRSCRAYAMVLKRNYHQGDIDSEWYGRLEGGVDFWRAV